MTSTAIWTAHFSPAMDKLL